jgi:hypothetical protein
MRDTVQCAFRLPVSLIALIDERALAMQKTSRHPWGRVTRADVVRAILERDLTPREGQQDEKKKKPARRRAA